MAKLINSLDELKQIFNGLVGENLYFRGVNEKKQLLPKIIRDKDYSADEMNVLKTFEHYFGAYSETAVNSGWEFLAMAQHYGLMTRLIDLTTNPYIALFFALYSTKKENEKYLVYCLKKEKTSDLLDGVIGDEEFVESTWVVYQKDQNYPLSKDLERYFKQMKTKNDVYRISPSMRNVRVLAQQGLFLVPCELNSEKIISFFEKETEVYEIDRSLRIETLKFLNNLGYNEYKLMPDLGSLCYEINKQTKEK